MVLKESELFHRLGVLPVAAAAAAAAAADAISIPLPKLPVE